MNEIGGYIELDTYTGPMLHKDRIVLSFDRYSADALNQGKADLKLVKI